MLSPFNAVPDNQRVGIYGECASFKTITDLHQALLAGGNQVFLLNARTPEQVKAEIGLPAQAESESLPPGSGGSSLKNPPSNIGNYIKDVVKYICYREKDPLGHQERDA
ncbi:MAG: hypothetical protein KGZ96_09100 [Clostridia bacterium]|jgi:hypothetical protein|nr:hypothetical protein [Clostridia bacterium]